MYKKTRSILLVLVSLLCFLFLTACGTSSKDNTSEKDKKEPTKTYSAKTIDTNELKDNLTNQNYVIVDLRKDEAFNGWKIDGISRGGHIKNSVHFPTTWLKEVKGDKLSSLLKKKGITSDKTIVLYHSDNNESKKMASKLNELNYSNILVYDKLDEWANNESLPMDALPNYEKLVYPEWVNDLINDKNPETYPGKGYLIIETSWGRPSKYYTSGHIPGTVHLDTNEIESESDWNIGPVSKIEKTLKKFGITPDTTVILYSENTMEGARGALAMMWAGVKDVRLLNGNLKA
ncbi:thiosulfate sulfurtransferase YnjE [Gottschalkia purinilytica]|uniref:Thiosulfate sulfurtransferase YnjE n=1 Tax=Gottschalkia purinilytica TaxID=1503 RepID=A0A0L0W7Q9_GOTPU|nr:rhodanese-like domain-containing protein [Gottschalkia purinilytica]KNF07579.1 thiosulfate sulfurtransferase YnjE [Gottschalkia purinilytica]